MKKRRLKIHDPDGIMEKVRFHGSLEIGEYPDLFIKIKEGEKPLLMPRFYIEEYEG